MIGSNGWMIQMPRKVTPPIERFFRRVEFQDNGCWLWTGNKGGSKGKRGYFRSTTKPTDPKPQAHVFIYEFVFGPVPKGLELDHKCNVGLCVNPFHLEAVTSEENIKRRRLRNDICPIGHFISLMNNEDRFCRACFNMS